MIFGLVPFLCRPVSQSEQLSAVQCHTGILVPPPPQYWTIEQWASAATILPPPPPFFPIVRRQLCVRHTSCSLSGHTRCLKWTILRSNTNYHLLWSATLPRPLGSDEDEILNSLDDLDQAWVIKQNLQTFQRSSLFSTQQLIST